MSDDVAAITKLIYRVAECLDTGDAEGFGALFAHGTLRIDGTDFVQRGAAEVAAGYRAGMALYEDGTPSTVHVNSNVIVEVEPSGDRASARTYFTVLQARPELPLQPIVSGRYLDSFERAGGEWRFAERVIQIRLAGDLRFHLAQPISG